MRHVCRAAFKAYVAKIVLRRNHITGELYKDDPTILAWDLVNEPYNPGDASGQVLQVSLEIIILAMHGSSSHLVFQQGISRSLHISGVAARLQAWAADLAAYVKQLDPNHLVMLGLIGMFGASTPSLLQENPYDLSMDTYSKGGIYQADPICQVMSVPHRSRRVLSSSAADRPGHPSSVAQHSYELAGRSKSSNLLPAGVRGRTSAPLWASQRWTSVQCMSTWRTSPSAQSAHPHLFIHLELLK